MKYNIDMATQALLTSQAMELQTLRARVAALEEEKRQAKAIVQNQCHNKGSASILRWALSESFKEIVKLTEELEGVKKANGFLAISLRAKRRG